MKYPSQYEGQMILDTLEAIDGIHTGYATESPLDDALRNFRCEVLEHFNRVFNSDDTSPWKTKLVRNKRKLYWDAESICAQRLEMIRKGEV